MEKSNVIKPLGNAKLLDPSVNYNIGQDPLSKKPLKMVYADPDKLKQNIMQQLRVLDLQCYCNAGKWYNLPMDMTSRFLESKLYYKGQLAFFYCEDLGEFFIMPFTLDGDKANGLDAYGRYSWIKPVPFNNSADYNKTPLEEYLCKLSLKVRYAPVTDVREEDIYDIMTHSAVIIQDYTPQLNVMNIIPRSVIMEPLLDVMADCIPFMRTSLITQTGITGMRVPDHDQAFAQISTASQAYLISALKGLPWVPVEAGMELQELVGKNAAKAEEFMLAMQSLDNYRLSLHGIKNSGLFEKKAHELQTEADLNGGAVGLVLQDKISSRQDAATIINSIWPIGLWYEPSETQTKADMNGDGVLYDRNETGENSGVDNGGQENDNDGRI